MNWYCYRWYPHHSRFIANLKVKKSLKSDHFCRISAPLKKKLLLGHPVQNWSPNFRLNYFWSMFILITWNICTCWYSSTLKIDLWNFCMCRFKTLLKLVTAILLFVCADCLENYESKQRYLSWDWLKLRCTKYICCHFGSGEGGFLLRER